MDLLALELLCDFYEREKDYEMLSQSQSKIIKILHSNLL